MKFILSALFIISYHLIQAKVINDTIPYQNMDIGNYVGAILEVRKEERYNLIEKFYHSLDDLKNNKISYEKSKGSSDRDSLINRKFLVLSANDSEGKKIIKIDYTKPLYYYLKLKDIESNDTLIFRYIYDSPFNFPFKIYPVIDVYQKVYKNHINRYKNAVIFDLDDFNGTKTALTPSRINIDNNPNMKDDITSVRFAKTKSRSGVVKYYLILNTSDPDVTVNNKGVWVLFEDGTKLSKPNHLSEVKAGRYGFNYYAEVPITINELKILSNKRIKKFRLYTYDEDVDISHRDVLKILSKEILNYKM